MLALQKGKLPKLDYMFLLPHVLEEANFLETRKIVDLLQAAKAADLDQNIFPTLSNEILSWINSNTVNSPNNSSQN